MIIPLSTSVSTPICQEPVLCFNLRVNDVKFGALDVADSTSSSGNEIRTMMVLYNVEHGLFIIVDYWGQMSTCPFKDRVTSFADFSNS